MGELRDTDLNEVRSIETFLSRSVVERYKSMGVEGILAAASDDPIVAQFATYEGMRFIVLLNGCHKTKALYDLGVYQAPLLYEDGEFMSRILDPCPKLSDVPLLDQESYNRMFLETFEEEPEEYWV